MHSSRYQNASKRASELVPATPIALLVGHSFQLQLCIQLQIHLFGAMAL